MKEYCLEERCSTLGVGTAKTTTNASDVKQTMHHSIKNTTPTNVKCGSKWTQEHKWWWKFTGITSATVSNTQARSQMRQMTVQDMQITIIDSNYVTKCTMNLKNRITRYTAIIESMYRQKIQVLKCHHM